jgi:hypothetical protein
MLVGKYVNTVQANVAYCVDLIHWSSLLYVLHHIVQKRRERKKHNPQKICKHLEIASLCWSSNIKWTHYRSDCVSIYQSVSVCLHVSTWELLDGFWWNFVMYSAIFLKQIGSRMHSYPKFSQREGGMLYWCQEKKVLECHSSLCPSGKEFLEQRSGTFHHKNTLGYVHYAIENYHTFEIVNFLITNTNIDSSGTT